MFAIKLVKVRLKRSVPPNSALFLKMSLVVMQIRGIGG